MHSRVYVRTFAAGLILLLTGPIRLNAQDLSQSSQTTIYRVINLGTLGGSASSANALNNHGWAAGVSNVTGNTDVHATLWNNGEIIDLGTLGGANSAVEWPFKSGHDKVVGIAETADVDPLGEQWSCSAFFIPPPTNHICLGFSWENNTMTALPTLGGNNGYASGANSAGLSVGWAETKVHDPTCAAPQVLQFEAVVYGPLKNQIRELPPLPGDQDGAATAINEKGQAVGISGTCDNAVGAFTAKHAVLWNKGVATDIGNLGGAGWNTPSAINNAGQIVGFSDLPGDLVNGVLTPNFHAFLWTQENGIQDLGTLAGDFYSEAVDINDRGQAVGLSCSAGFASCRAFVWQDGVMTDLNTLIPAGSSLYLTSAAAINTRGEISGQACVLSAGSCLPTSQMPAFLAIPEGPGSSSANSPAKVLALPDNLRLRLMNQRGLKLFDN
jgi:probable HAF family extracellular repeat protein